MADPQVSWRLHTRKSTGESWALLVHALPYRPGNSQPFQGCIHFIILHIVLLLSLALSNDLCSEPHGLESDLTESKLLFFPGGKNI